MFSVHQFRQLSVTFMNLFAFVFFAIVFFVIPLSPVSAQVGIETDLWQWSEDAAHHQAIVQVELDGATGTGIIVQVNRDKPVADGFQGWCLTAWHVVSDDNDRREIRIRYADGRSVSKCKILAKDEQNDTALLWVWVPEHIQAVKVATMPVKPGELVEIAGLGGGSDLNSSLRHFDVTASVTTTPSKVFADVALLPGDSGGPVFNELGEVVGVVSGGWFWWDGKVTSASGNPIRTTWPARTSNLKSVVDLMAKADTKPAAQVVASR